jgi:hypothetical protein
LQNYRINSQLRTGCKKLVLFSQWPEIIIFSANGNATMVVTTMSTHEVGISGYFLGENLSNGKFYFQNGEN